MLVPSSRSSILPICGALFLCFLAEPTYGQPDCTISCTGTSCTCNDTGGPPCEIDTATTVPAGAVIDCAGEDVVIENTVQVTNGLLTLEAQSLTVAATHKIDALRTQAGVPFGIAVELTGTATVVGMLRANSDSGGGHVRVKTTGSTGDILIQSDGQNGILANGTASGASGGRIELISARDVTIQDGIEAHGSLAGTTQGGEILIEAGRDIGVHQRLDAAGYDESGGFIRLFADAGTITVAADSSGTTYVKAEGHGPQGDGGAIEMLATEIVVDALLSAQSGVSASGGESAGGSVRLHAQRDAGSGTSGGITIDTDGDIDATGGALGSRDGGAVELLSEGDITIATGVSIATSSDAGGGNGGDITVEAAGWLTVGDATVEARGDWSGSNQGIGAQIELEACYLSIGAGAEVSAAGYDGGTITLRGRESLAISATSGIDAGGVGGEDGAIELWHRLAGRCASQSPPVGCAGDCAVGTCSNEATLSCLEDWECIVGCNMGTCERTCDGNPSQSCTHDSGCGTCSTGQCQPNPDTGGVTSQFDPAPEYLEESNLLPCT